MIAGAKCYHLQQDSRIIKIVVRSAGASRVYRYSVTAMYTRERERERERAATESERARERDYYRAHTNTHTHTHTSESAHSSAKRRPDSFLPVYILEDTTILSPGAQLTQQPIWPARNLYTLPGPTGRRWSAEVGKLFPHFFSPSFPSPLPPRLARPPPPLLRASLGRPGHGVTEYESHTGVPGLPVCRLNLPAHRLSHRLVLAPGARVAMTGTRPGHC